MDSWNMHHNMNIQEANYLDNTGVNNISYFYCTSQGIKTGSYILLIFIFIFLWHCQYLDYTESNGRIIGWIGKDLEGSGHDLINVLFHHLPGQTEESHKKNFSQDSPCSGCVEQRPSWRIIWTYIRSHNFHPHRKLQYSFPGTQ
jgi:hypothetical protein